MPATAELVLLGIRSAVRLADAARHAYVDATRSRALTLPLPRFAGAIDERSAALFYRGEGATLASPGSRTHDWTDRVWAGSALAKEECSEYVAQYLEDRALLVFRAGGATELRASAEPGSLAAGAWLPLLEIRQWSRGTSPDPSPLRRMAGALLEIGVDAFRSDPSLLHAERGTGAAVASFLDAVEGLPLAGAEPPQRVAALFATLTSVIRESPELFADAPAARLLVLHVTRELAGAAATVGAAGGVDVWAPRILRAALLEAPQLYAGESELRAGLAALASRALLDVLAGPSAPALSQAGLDGVLAAALRLCAADPRRFGASSDALAAFVRSAADAVAPALRRLGVDLLPRVLQGVLAKTSADVERLAPVGHEPLLASASRCLLERLAAPDASGRWTPRFAVADVAALLDFALDEVAENPHWLRAADGAGPSPLAALVAAVPGAVAQMREPRLRPAAVLELLRAALAAAGRSLALAQLDGPSGEPVVKLVLGALFAILRDDSPPAAAWALARDGTTVAIAAEALAQLARAGSTPARLKTLEQVLQAEVLRVAAGAAFERGELAARLAAALRAG